MLEWCAGAPAAGGFAHAAGVAMPVCEGVPAACCISTARASPPPLTSHRTGGGRCCEVPDGMRHFCEPLSANASLGQGLHLLKFYVMRKYPF